MKRRQHARGFSGLRRRAFTLIELLVVVAIIALLVAILLPSLAAAREQGKRVACSANLKGIGSAVRIFAGMQDGRVPMGQLDPGHPGGWATNVVLGTDFLFLNDSAGLNAKLWICPALDATKPGLISVDQHAFYWWFDPNTASASDSDYFCGTCNGNATSGEQYIRSGLATPSNWTLAYVHTTYEYFGYTKAWNPWAAAVAYPGRYGAGYPVAQSAHETYKLDSPPVQQGMTQFDYVDTGKTGLIYPPGQIASGIGSEHLVTRGQGDSVNMPIASDYTTVDCKGPAIAPTYNGTQTLNSNHKAVNSVLKTYQNTVYIDGHAEGRVLTDFSIQNAFYVESWSGLAAENVRWFK